MELRVNALSHRQFKAMLDFKTYVNRQQAMSCIFEYIEVFYNRKRRHSYLGLVSPQVFEDEYNQKTYENAA